MIGLFIFLESSSGFLQSLEIGGDIRVVILVSFFFACHYPMSPRHYFRSSHFRKSLYYLLHPDLSCSVYLKMCKKYRKLGLAIIDAEFSEFEKFQCLYHSKQFQSWILPLSAQIENNVSHALVCSIAND